MAYNDFPPVRNADHVREIFFHVTGVADIGAARGGAAAGFTIVRGSPEIASFVSSAEGVAVITLDAVYVDILEVRLSPLNIDDMFCTLDAYSVANKTITLTFRQQSTEAVAAADKDPDSGVIKGCIVVLDETHALT